MWKLIKMDFYRLFSSKTIKVGALAACLVSVGYTLLSLGIIALAKFAFKQDPSIADGMGFLLSQVSWMNGVDFAEIVFGGTAVLSLFIGCMISASFIGSEQSCGYTKNFAGQIANKGYMAISKFAVTSVAQIMILLIYAVVGSICAELFLGQYITGYDLQTLLAALGLRLLLYVAINAIIVFICTFTKSHAIAMIAGCIFGLGVTKVAYLSLDMLLSILRIDFNIIYYMPDGINGQLALDTVGDLAQKAIIVSVAFVVAFVAANYYVVRNRDVK
jgi:hypothetical protein